MKNHNQKTVKKGVKTRSNFAPGAPKQTGKHLRIERSDADLVDNQPSSDFRSYRQDRYYNWFDKFIMTYGWIILITIVLLCIFLYFYDIASLNEITIEKETCENITTILETKVISMPIILQNYSFTCILREHRLNYGDLKENEYEILFQERAYDSMKVKMCNETRFFEQIVKNGQCSEVIKSESPCKVENITYINTENTKEVCTKEPVEEINNFGIPNQSYFYIILKKEITKEWLNKECVVSYLNCNEEYPIEQIAYDSEDKFCCFHKKEIGKGICGNKLIKEYQCQFGEDKYYIQMN